MSASTTYKHVIGGKLKLKRPLGSSAPGTSAKLTTQSVSAASSIISSAAISSPSQHTAAAAASEEKKDNEQDNDGTSDDIRAVDKRQKTERVQAVDGKTKAERDFEEAQIRREADVIRRKISKSHRQAIEEYNAKLASLSEHHDIPRVGPG